MQLSKNGITGIALTSFISSVIAGLAVFFSFVLFPSGDREIAAILITIIVECLFLAVSFFLYRIFASKSVWKIAEVSKIAQNVAGGDYSQTLQIEDHDPLAELKSSLNTMAEKLRQLDRDFAVKVNEETGEVKKNAELTEVQNRVLQENRLELEKYKLAVAEAPVHIIITDPEGKILYANRAATKITGYSKEEMTGETPRLWGGQMGPEYYSRMWKTLKEEKTYFTGEIRNRRKNGQIYEAEIRVEPILNHENEIKFFVGIEEDITHRKEVDRMKTEFISLASHQLRTPLTAIRWLTEEALTENKNDTGQVKKTLERIYEATLRMVELVKTLLSISRIESGRILVRSRQLDLGKLAEEAVNLLKPKLEAKSQTVEIEVGQGVLEITSDYDLLLNCVVNLISNAQKYSPEKTNIAVKINKDSGWAVIEVVDRGMGIPEKDQPRIFERFFRAGNVALGSEEGTGLGLYLVKQIVALLKGELTFVSQEGKGTTFTVKLPV